jgi:L-rhamnose isomerase
VSSGEEEPGGAPSAPAGEGVRVERERRERPVKLSVESVQLTTAADDAEEKGDIREAVRLLKDAEAKMDEAVTIQAGLTEEFPDMRKFQKEFKRYNGQLVKIRETLFRLEMRLMRMEGKFGPAGGEGE